MPVFTKGKKNLLFIHVPKTGGTSMEMLFQLSGWRTGYLDLNLKGKSFNHLRICAPQHMHAEMLKQQLVLHKFNGVFMTVRHPYDRYRSEYAYKYKVNCDPSAVAVETWTRTVLKAYSKDQFIFDNHIRPQHEFYLPGTAVYKLENGFNKMIPDLAKKYKIEFADKELRKMSRQEESGFSSSDVELNDTVKSMLIILYQQDFEQFGYKPALVGDTPDTVNDLLEQSWSRPFQQTPAFPKWILRLFSRRRVDRRL